MPSEHELSKSELAKAPSLVAHPGRRSGTVLGTEAWGPPEG